nr:hypothetical protein JVH1_3839 [Rhodococcus sp. JVH1]
MNHVIAPDDPATRRQWVLDHDPFVTRGELLDTLNQIADWPLRVGPATVLAAHGLTDLADTLRALPPAGGLMEELLDNPTAGEELETTLVAGRDALRELLDQAGHPAWMRERDQRSDSAGISRLVASVAADVGGTHWVRTAGRAAESIILLGCNKRLFDSAEQRERFVADLDLGLRVEIASHASLVDWVPTGTRPAAAESSAPPLPAEGTDDSAPESHTDQPRDRRWLVADEIFSAIDPIVAQSNLNGVLAEATADWVLRFGPAEALRACRFWDEHDMVATLPMVTPEMFRQPSRLRPHVRALKRATLALEEREIDLSHAGIHHNAHQRLAPAGQASSLAVKADLLARTPSSKAGYWAYRLLCTALTVTELDPTTSSGRLRQSLEQAVKRIWFTGIPDMEWIVKLDVLRDIDPDTDAQTWRISEPAPTPLGG